MWSIGVPIFVSPIPLRLKWPEHSVRTAKPVCNVLHSVLVKIPAHTGQNVHFAGSCTGDMKVWDWSATSLHPGPKIYPACLVPHAPYTLHPHLPLSSHHLPLHMHMGHIAVPCSHVSMRNDHIWCCGLLAIVVFLLTFSLCIIVLK